MSDYINCTHFTSNSSFLHNCITWKKFAPMMITTALFLHVVFQILGALTSDLHRGSLPLYPAGDSLSQTPFRPFPRHWMSKDATGTVCCLYRVYDGLLSESRSWFVKYFVFAETAFNNISLSRLSTRTFPDLSTLPGRSSELWKLSHCGVTLGCAAGGEDWYIYCKRSGHR